MALVLAPKLAGADSYPIPALIASLGSLASISIATIWQKRTGNSLDLRSGTAIQFGASALAALPFAYATETMAIEQTPELWVGLLWSAFGLSIGAIFLLLMMIRRGAIVAVSSWLFLVPPAAAIMNFLAFGETLAPIQIVGMAVAALGVALTTRG